VMGDILKKSIDFKINAFFKFYMK